MLTAREALATTHLETPQDFSLHKHLEVRIWDAIANGGSHIIYGGEMPDNVKQAMIALGYTITFYQSDTGAKLTKISWDKII